ncbi:MAG TPA: biotin/lipoyl-binding protein, partial [Acidimicrobiales bacterium]|nr:biotin/lipoyl-binding protein [Acidimicrobiales bacterium]
MPDGVLSPRLPRRRRWIMVTVITVGALLIGGATAWAVGVSGASGYRLVPVVRATIGNSTDIVGTVEPVSNVNSSFQVAGKVTRVSVTVGQTVSAGQLLATLDPTPLSEALSSAQSSLQSDQAKLTQDEATETSSASTGNTTTTTTPSSGTSGSSSAYTAAIAQAQNMLVADQKQESTDQLTEAANLGQAEVACAAAPTSPTTTTTTTTTAPVAQAPQNTPTGGKPPSGGSSGGGGTSGSPGGTASSGGGMSSGAGCEAALQQAYEDEQLVSSDQHVVESAEAVLGNDLSGASGSSSNSGNSGNAGNSGATQKSNAIGSTSNGVASSNSAATPGGSSSSGVATPAQIASDQAAIDDDEANLVKAQQALNEAQLDSPISGTVATVAITAGDTVGADSATEVIEIISTQAYEVTGTLTSAQVNSVKVGSVANVVIDGLTGTLQGTVSQVGPVQSASGTYSYPVVIALPNSVSGLFAGSTANVSILTGHAVDAVAVPTSAVITAGSASFVEVLKDGVPTRHAVKVGMVGSTFTQIRSGLTEGTEVVLADLSVPVPSSNT